MNGKQAKALGLSLLFASSCLAVSFGDMASGALKWSKATCVAGKDLAVAHPYRAAALATSVVAATAGSVELNRRRNARNARLATQKAEATRQANRTWFDKVLGR